MTFLLFEVKCLLSGNGSMRIENLLIVLVLQSGGQRAPHLLFGSVNVKMATFGRLMACGLKPSAGTTRIAVREQEAVQVVCLHLTALMIRSVDWPLRSRSPRLLSVINFDN
jgi:hypothetical protein